MSDSLAGIDCVVLCGGEGTRARSYLGDTPKVLAPIKGRPFIEWHIDYLRMHGAKRILLLAGHGHEQVRDWLTQHPIPDVLLVTDNKCEGCATALNEVRELFGSPYQKLLITNGDTLLCGDLSAALEYLNTSPAVFTVGGRSTGVVLMSAWQISKRCFIATPIEILYDFSFIDIGTQEGYEQAQHFV